MNKNTAPPTYYRIKAKYKDYHGIRFFKVWWNTDTTIQVCIQPGTEYRRGKNHTLGIYVINKLTLFSNYLAIGYAEPCSQSEYDKAFKKVVKILK